MSLTLAALSDPTRRAILARLVNGPASVNELAEPFAMSQQAISKHLAVLEHARLLAKTKQGRQQICRLEAAPMKEVATFVASYRRHWEDAFDRIDEFLHELHPDHGERRDP